MNVKQIAITSSQRSLNLLESQLLVIFLSDQLKYTLSNPKVWITSIYLAEFKDVNAID